MRQQGSTVGRFEESIRSDISTGIVRSAVGAGVNAPDVYIDTLFNFVEETREVTWARLSEGDLAEPLAEPSDADLQAFYDENTGEFERPETKSIRYAWLTPDMLVDQIEPDEDQLRTLYETREAQYLSLIHI